ncbi:hypothetical protein [Bacillus thuringiensis]|uniref:hypothetical protein n=1 Tax=Bacillus thuringiensis TaxID=1428 RepID=UPI0020D22DDF|nr:hypothetical protein [Bacillus thuringiensis]
MYFISKEEDLIGKEIVFTHMAQFANAITIVTKDKGIFVVNQWSDCDGSEICIYNEYRAKDYILRHDWLRKTLHEKGIISQEEIQEYEDRKRLELQKQQEESKKRQEEQERINYERLRAKYGDASTDNTEKELTEIRIKGATYKLNDVVALVGYNEGKDYTAVMKIDKFSQWGKQVGIGEYLDGEKIYTANADYIRSLATEDEIAAEIKRRKDNNLKSNL